MTFLRQMLKTWWGAVAFYTIIPLPNSWSIQIERAARFAPIVGLLLGVILALADQGLRACHVPILTRSMLVVTAAVALTGGLHLDGVIDTADGLAVLDPQKRLTIMKDSTTGAFGVMAAVIVLGLKIVALSDIESHRWLSLILTLGWGRWGQVCAIGLYPYLRAEGKGSFHKDGFQFPQDILLGGIILSLIAVISCLYLKLAWLTLMPLGFGIGIPLFIGWYFDQKLGGHTGDTYGAVVEWSEAFYLCVLTIVFSVD